MIRGWLGSIGDAVACGTPKWIATFGDPVLPGTVISLAYCLAGLLVFLVMRRPGSGDRRLWLICGLILWFQAVNTHLDIQILGIAIGRCLALTGGWYQDRKVVLYLALGLLALVGVLLILILALGARRRRFSSWLLVAGVATDIGLTLGKGAGLDQGNRFLTERLGPIRGEYVVELGGIAIACLAALIAWWGLRGPKMGGRPEELRKRL